MFDRWTGVNSNYCYLCVEINPPKGVSVEAVKKRYHGNLNGIDFVNITDNALARMRMSSLSFANWFKQEFAIEPLVNVSCRDRNSLGLQSDLLASDLFGVRSLVALTGDAVSVGDHGFAKGVFEMNSRGLLDLVDKLNQGFDLAGNKLDGATCLKAGVVCNPNARNIDSELKKLEDKVKHGASFVLSQPVFDREQSKEFFLRTATLGIPVLMGLMPFSSVEGAKRLSSVPGLKISEELLSELAQQDSGNFKEYSLNFCLELAKQNRNLVAGFHVISGVNPRLALDLTSLLVKEFRGT